MVPTTAAAMAMRVRTMSSVARPAAATARAAMAKFSHPDCSLADTTGAASAPGEALGAAPPTAPTPAGAADGLALGSSDSAGAPLSDGPGTPDSPALAPAAGADAPAAPSQTVTVAP